MNSAPKAHVSGREILESLARGARVVRFTPRSDSLRTRRTCLWMLNAPESHRVHPATMATLLRRNLIAAGPSRGRAGEVFYITEAGRRWLTGEPG